MLGIALAVRILLSVSAYWRTRDASIFYTPDSMQYVVPAREMVEHHRFFSDGSTQARVWNLPTAPAPEITRTPGYPLLLAVGLWLGHLEIVTLELQILLSCFTVYMVYATAGLLFASERTALIAAALYAIEPLSVLFSSLLSAEALLTALLMTAVYFLVRYLKGKSLADPLASGGALAMGVYVRPAGYFLPVLIAAALIAWALLTHQRDKSRLFAHLGTFLFVFFGITGLWQLRNWISTGYTGFSAVFSEDMYCCMAASILASNNHLPYTEMENRLGCYDLGIYFDEHPDRRGWPIADIVNSMRSNAEHIISGNRVTFAQIYLNGVL